MGMSTCGKTRRNILERKIYKNGMYWWHLHEHMINTLAHLKDIQVGKHKKNYNKEKPTLRLNKRLSCKR